MSLRLLRLHDLTGRVTSAALESASLTYLKAHYHDGVTSVFPAPDSSTRFIVQIVANKYNPNNFW